MLNPHAGNTLAIALSCSLHFACAAPEETNTTPKIPDDAVLITESNALAITTELKDQYRAINTASKSASKSCSSGGTVTFNLIKTTNPSNGTITFTNCNEFNVTTQGLLQFTTDFRTGTNYILVATGALTINDNADAFSINSITFTENGEAISPSPYPYIRSLTYVITGNATIGGGVLFQATTALTGISNTCPYDGVILVSGANNSKLKISFPSSNFIEIALDDGVSTNGTNYVVIPGSPFATNSNGPCF